jgi:ATP-dependent protease Clp ATPase subunit
LTAYESKLVEASQDREDVPNVFGAILINCKMDCSKRASSYLLLDNILIDAMFGDTVIFARDVFGPGVERLLYAAT